MFNNLKEREVDLLAKLDTEKTAKADQIAKKNEFKELYERAKKLNSIMN